MNLLTFPGTDATVTGRPDQVRADVELAHRAGRLRMVSPPVPAGRGLVKCDVLLHPLRPVTQPIGPRPSSAPASWWTPRRAAVAAAVTVVVLGALAWGTVLLIQWVIAHLAVIAAGLLVAVMVIYAAGKTFGVCPGIVVHCRGCSH